MNNVDSLVTVAMNTQKAIVLSEYRKTIQSLTKTKKVVDAGITFGLSKRCREKTITQNIFATLAMTIIC